MNKIILPFIVVFILLTVLMGSSGLFYEVDETQQAVVTQFGELIGQPKVEAGLYTKTPFIQTVDYFEKRILEWDGDPNQIPTLDKRYIWVDVTARWRIKDVLKFMQSVKTEANAQGRLDDIIDASTRDIISSHMLVEAVRNSNRLVNVQEKDKIQMPAEVGATELDSIKGGREELSRKILRRAAEVVPNYGIELIDVRIKRINYVREVQAKVYERMVSERKRAAEQFRSEGQGKKAEIEGQMRKELEQIRAEAYKTAQEVKGKADAKAIKIYAEAYNKDPEFYAFVKSLENYRKSIDEKTTLILSTENDLFQYLQDIDKSGLLIQ
jgi:membrane protease subunit HflC